MEPALKIGELARRTQCQAETIRFYEREGLLPAPMRTAGNYRVYGRAHVERLAFIRNCRALDMTLDEIRQLLRFRDLPQDNCHAAHALLDEHVARREHFHITQRHDFVPLELGQPLKNRYRGERLAVERAIVRHEIPPSTVAWPTRPMPTM